MAGAPGGAERGSGCTTQPRSPSASRAGEQEVAVVGGGNSAGQAALFLAQERGTGVAGSAPAPTSRQTMSRYLIDKIARSETHIDVLTQTEVVELHGSVRELEERGARSTASRAHAASSPARALFVLIGADPHHPLARGLTRARPRTGSSSQAARSMAKRLAGPRRARPLFLETSQRGGVRRRRRARAARSSALPPRSGRDRWRSSSCTSISRPSSARSRPQSDCSRRRVGSLVSGQVQAVRDRGSLRTALNAELAEDARDVDAGGLLGHERARRRSVGWSHPPASSAST